MKKSKKKVKRIKELPSKIKIIREIPRAEAMEKTSGNISMGLQEGEQEVSSAKVSDISLILQSGQLMPAVGTAGRAGENRDEDEEKNKQPYSTQGYEGPKKNEREYQISPTSKSLNLRESSEMGENSRRNEMENAELRQLRGDESPKNYALMESKQEKEKSKKNRPWE